MISKIFPFDLFCAIFDFFSDFLISKILSFDFSNEILISKIYRLDFFCVIFDFLSVFFFIYKICRFDFQNETFHFANGVLVLNGFVSVT